MKIRIFVILYIAAVIFAQPSGHDAIPVADHFRGVFREPTGIYTWDSPNPGDLVASFDMGYNNYNYFWDGGQNWRELKVGGTETDYERFYALTGLEVGISRWMSVGLRAPYIVRMTKGTEGHFRKSGDFGDVVIQTRFEPLTDATTPFRTNLGFGLKLPAGSDPVETDGNNAGSGSTDWIIRLNNTVHVWKLIFSFGAGYTVTGHYDLIDTRINYGNVTDFGAGVAIEPLTYMTLALRIEGFYQDRITYREEYSDSWHNYWNDSYCVSFLPEILFHIPQTPVSISAAGQFDMQGKRVLGGSGLILRMTVDGKLLP